MGEALTDREWEEACLAAITTGFGDGSRWRDDWGRVLRDVRLEGTKPDTAIVVDFFDAQRDQEIRWRFPLWSGEFEGSTGARDAAASVAGIIGASLDDPAWPIEGVSDFEVRSANHR